MVEDGKCSWELKQTSAHANHSRIVLKPKSPPMFKTFSIC